MNTISKLALVCAVTLFAAHVTYGMDNDNNQKPNLEDNQPEESKKIVKTVSNAEIFEAALLGKVDFFEEHNGIHLTINDEFRETPLHIACEYGHTDIVTFIVKKDPELLKEKDCSGATPLHIACEHGHIDIVKFIVKKDPELLKEKEDNCMTPVHRACWKDHAETIKFLLLFGADFNAVYNDGYKPLMICERDTRRIICDYMEELASSPIASDDCALFAYICKNNKVFAQKAAQFMMSLKRLRKYKNVSFIVPKPVIKIILKELAQLMGENVDKLIAIGKFFENNDVDKLIQKWTTEDKNNNNN